MTALSVIFFVFPTACSVYAYSKSETEQHAKNAVSENSFKPLEPYLSKTPTSIYFSGNQNLNFLKCETKENTFHKSLLYKNGNTLINHYQHQVPTTSQEIFNIVESPENEPEWISIFISLIAVISSFVVPYRLHQKERHESINEGYWIREVIMPKINDLAFKVTAAFKSAITLSEDEFVDTLSNSLLPKLGELRDSLYLFNGFKSLQDDIEVLEGICDELEEKVSDNIGAPNETRITDISIFHTKLITKLIDTHRKIG